MRSPQIRFDRPLDGPISRQSPPAATPPCRDRDAWEWGWIQAPLPPTRSFSVGLAGFADHEVQEITRRLATRAPLEALLSSTP